MSAEKVGLEEEVGLGLKDNSYESIIEQVKENQEAVRQQTKYLIDIEQTICQRESMKRFEERINGCVVVPKPCYPLEQIDTVQSLLNLYKEEKLHEMYNDYVKECRSQLMLDCMPESELKNALQRNINPELIKKKIYKEIRKLNKERKEQNE
jgi:hypothetical protein